MDLKIIIMTMLVGLSCAETISDRDWPEKLCVEVAESICGLYMSEDDQECRATQYSKCMVDYRDERACKADCMDIVSRLTDQRDDYYERWIACSENEPQ